MKFKHFPDHFPFSNGNVLSEAFNGIGSSLHESEKLSFPANIILFVFNTSRLSLAPFLVANMGCSHDPLSLRHRIQLEKLCLLNVHL